MTARLFGIIGLVLFCSLSTPVLSKDWAIDYVHSKVNFIGSQSDARFEGEFKKFTANIDLDPSKPEGGKITAIIDIASATAGSRDRDDYLPQADWFNATKFPQAQFTSSAIRKTGDHAYVADGLLTIKGIAQPVSLPFTLMPEGDHWRAQGKTTLLRNDFHIGEHQWASEAYVKYAVDVTIDLAAKPN